MMPLCKEEVFSDYYKLRSKLFYLLFVVFYWQLCIIFMINNEIITLCIKIFT